MYAQATHLFLQTAGNLLVGPLESHCDSDHNTLRSISSPGFMSADPVASVHFLATVTPAARCFPAGQPLV